MVQCEKCQPCKHKNVNSSSQAGARLGCVHLQSPHKGRRDQSIPRACCPVSLAKSASSQNTKRAGGKKQNKQTNKKPKKPDLGRHLALISDMHIRTCTHTYKQKELTLKL